jgi:hypothetical protein
MTGPLLGLKYFLLFVFFAFLIFLLTYSIVRRRSLKKSIPTGILFLILAGFAIYVYRNNNKNEYEASKKFLGDYKLEKLDRKKCDSCKVRLYDGYTYDILVKDKIVGHGKWHIESAIDIPGYFLKVENGPTWVVWEHDRLIEYIDRTQEK